MNLHIPDDVVFRDLAGEAVLLNLSTGTYYGLDAVGTRIWHLLADHGTTEEIVKTLLDEFEVEENQLRRDVDDLIRQLIDKGLLKTDAQKTPSAR